MLRLRTRPGPLVVAGLVIAFGLLLRLTLRAYNVSPQTADFIRFAVFVTGVIIVARLYGRVRQQEISADYLGSIVESTDDAIISKNLDGLITSWNPAAERLFGYAAAEVTGRPILTIVPEDRHGEERGLLARIANGARVDHFETRRLRKDGSTIDVSITMSPVVSRGQMVGVSTIARDITERRRIDRLRNELLDRETLLRADAVDARDRLAFVAEVGAVLTSTLDYDETLDRAVHLAVPRLADFCTLLVHDERGALRLAACAHATPEKESIVRELTNIVVAAASTPGAIPTFAERVLQSGKPLIVTNHELTAAAARLQTVEPEVLRLGSDLQPFAYLGLPLAVRGRAVGVLGLASTAEHSRREYTADDLPLAEEFARRVSIAVENARLFRHSDELNRLKDEFLATLSHELRTPLSAVLGWSRLLASGQLDAERSRQALAAIERNAQAQANLVDDILDVARGMAGNLRLELGSVDLVAVVNRGVDSVAPAATIKKIDVGVRADQPVAVVGDPQRLQQVVWNLLSNAVKFTPTGGRVVVAIARCDDVAELRVTDTGAGIAPDFLPYVFDKFRQADASATRPHGGLGLGLAIARHIVELHGGTIEARSEGAGLGATFVVRLPAAPA